MNSRVCASLFECIFFWCMHVRLYLCALSLHLLTPFFFFFSEVYLCLESLQRVFCSLAPIRNFTSIYRLHFLYIILFFMELTLCIPCLYCFWCYLLIFFFAFILKHKVTRLFAEVNVSSYLPELAQPLNRWYVFVCICILMIDCFNFYVYELICVCLWRA